MTSRQAFSTHRIEELIIELRYATKESPQSRHRTRRSHQTSPSTEQRLVELEANQRLALGLLELAKTQRDQAADLVKRLAHLEKDIVLDLDNIKSRATML
jgi:hypothetical protein